jgi:hypothetical protein
VLDREGLLRSMRGFVGAASAALVSVGACGRSPLELGSRPDPAPDAAAIHDVTSTAEAGQRWDSAPDAPSQTQDVGVLDGTADAIADGSLDASFDAAADVEPADAGACFEATAEPYVSCGCGCCGGVEPYTICYYPSLGERLQTLVTNDPTPEDCSTVGCTDGTAYLCCAPSVKVPEKQQSCVEYYSGAYDHLDIRLSSHGTCIWLSLSSPPPIPRWPLELPPGWGVNSARRAPCDAPQSYEHAIGAIGAIREDPALVFHVSLTLFFDVGTGIAEPVRLEVRDLIPSSCPP